MKIIKSIKKLIALAFFIATPISFAQNYINLVHSGVSDYVPIFIAKKENIFEKNNIHVNLKHLPSSTTYAPGLISNSFQIATLNPPAFLQAIDAGIDLVAISTGGIVMEKNANYLGLIAKEGSNINSAQDLVGKKIGINAVNGIFQVMVREWLKANKVDPKDVIFIEGPLHQLGDILKAGNVDAVATIDPFMGRVMKDGGYKVLTHLVESFPDGIPNFMFVTTRSWAEKNKEAITAFRKSIDEAMAISNNSPERAREAFGSFVKLPPEVLAKTNIIKYRPGVGEDTIGKWVEILENQGMLKTKINPSSLIFK